LKTNKYFLIALLLLLSVLLTGCSSEEQIAGAMSYEPEKVNEDDRPQPYLGFADSYLFDVDMRNDEFRGVWVTTVINLDFPSSQGISAQAMKREIDSIIARTVDMGLNAIIFQVRPTADAFYESGIFPWSHWLSGTQGVGIADFDPLAYWIEQSHAHGLELHAWINPYRVIHTITNSSDPNTLAENHPVRLRPELAVGWTDTNGRSGLFLDPGLPDARQLIIDGIEDLIRNYNVDGIHFDDYFYPDTNFDDAATFARYGGDMDLHDWRRENVNTLIRDIQTKINSLNSELRRDVVWGISPTAIWKNASSHPLGVPTTRGMESYHSLYADTRLWVTEGWVDYIMPQIYWYIGFEIADFEAVLNWWIDLCRGTDVRLYIGHAAWREEDDHQSPRWRGEMIRQLEMLAESDIVQGSVFFRYMHLRGSVGDAIRDFYAQKDLVQQNVRRPVMTLDTLSVGTPVRNTTMTAAPDATVGFNITGTSLADRPLYLDGVEVTNRTVEGFFSVHVPLEAGENVFTFTQEGQPDAVRIITRNPPAPAPEPTPPATITQVTTPRYATVISDAAWVFPRNTTTGGSDWMMSRGQQDRVIAESSNGFLRLSSGKWVRSDAVTVQTHSTFIEDVLRNGEYRVGGYRDMVAWQSDVFSGAYAHFDGTVLTVYFGMHTQTPPLRLPTNLSETMFYSVDSGINDGVPYIAFTIREDAGFDGHYISFENGEFRLNLRRRRSLAQGDKPLTGITILIDAGHGGEDYGAIGPLGRDMAEKDIVLINTRRLAARLTNLGATVFLTRNDDITVSLQDRIELSRRIKPDLFLSLHVNSVAETTNATNIRGFTVWYRNPGSAAFARTILDNMYDINPGTNRYRNINQSNFFVCRPQWAPHVLLESSFIVNIDDFVWLIDPNEQNRMADATVEAILEHFS